MPSEATKDILLNKYAHWVKRHLLITVYPTNLHLV